MYDGLWRYLVMEEAERKRFNRSNYNKRIRDVASSAIDFLVLFCQRQDESELDKTLTDERVDRLATALITTSKRKSAGEKHKGAVERDFRLAAMLMTKGIIKCLERSEGPFESMALQAGREVMLSLGEAATGQRQYFAHVDGLLARLRDERRKEGRERESLA